jgi:hypothetical protein
MKNYDITDTRKLIEKLGRAPLQGWIDQRPEGSVSLQHTDVRATIERIRKMQDKKKSKA